MCCLPQSFQVIKILQVHKKSHDETSHHCDQCDQDFTNIGNLSRHANSAHKKLSFSCAVADCGKIFHRKDVMKKHFTKCRSRAENSIAPDEKNEMIQMNLEFSREANWRTSLKLRKNAKNYHSITYFSTYHKLLTMVFIDVISTRTQGMGRKTTEWKEKGTKKQMMDFASHRLPSPSIAFRRC